MPPGECYLPSCIIYTASYLLACIFLQYTHPNVKRLVKEKRADGYKTSSLPYNYLLPRLILDDLYSCQSISHTYIAHNNFFATSRTGALQVSARKATHVISYTDPYWLIIPARSHHHRHILLHNFFLNYCREISLLRQTTNAPKQKFQMAVSRSRRKLRKRVSSQIHVYPSQSSLSVGSSKNT